MRAKAIALAVLLSAALGPAALAANPLDDDARSGGDAPDLRRLALPVAPGAYSGTMTWPADTEDWYAFEAEAGDVLSVAFAGVDGVFGTLAGPDGVTYSLFGHDDAERVPIPFKGTWALGMSVNLFVPPVPGLPGSAPIPAPYTFSFGVEKPETYAAWHSVGAYQIAEFAWDEPGGVLLYSRSASPAFLAPASADYYLEYEVVHEGVRYGWTGGGGIAHPGAADRVRIGGTPVDARLPEEPMPFETMATMGADDLYGERGRVRIVTYGADPDVSSWIVAAMTANVRHARAEVTERVSWRGPGEGGLGEAETPVLRVVGERAVEMRLDRTFLGDFWAGSQGARATRPDGVTFELGEGQSVWLLRPMEGTWRFELPPETRAGFGADMVHLYGAFLPKLGVL